MRELPAALRRYLWLLNLACLFLLLVRLVPFVTRASSWKVPPSRLEAVVVFIILAFIGHRIVLQINRSVSQDLATPVHMAAILLFPSPFTLLIIFVSSLASESFSSGSPIYKRTFNVIHPTLSVGLTVAVCSLVVPIHQLLRPEHLVPALPGLVLLVLVFYLFDVLLMIGLLAILQQRMPWVIWWQDYRHALLPELAGSSIGIGGAVLWQFDPLALAFVVLPVIALRVAFTAIAEGEARTQSLRRRGEQLEAVLIAGKDLRLQHTQADLLLPLAEAARTIVNAPVVTGYVLDEEDPNFLRRVVLLSPDALAGGLARLPLALFVDNPAEVVIEGLGRTLPIVLDPDQAGIAGLLLLSGGPLTVGSDERHALAILATQAAIALQNARLHERTLAQASEDGLTGLLNHRAFQTRLEEEVARAQRGDHPLALLMIDLDDFSLVNNTYGHQVGDATLAATAKILRRNIRLHDLLARYGGDEFAVILPETDMEEAHSLAERIRGAIDSVTVAEDSVTIPIRASIGIAALPTHATTREDLIRAADHAAYAAKHSGKGRVCCPEDVALPLERDPVALAAQLQHANLATVAALAAAVDAKDPYTRGHSQRVSAYAAALAGALRFSSADVARIELAGLLHDVGKIGIPDAVLTKPSKLTDAEFAVIAEHSVIGERVLAGVPFLREILPAVRHHHERWDGAGYPDRLQEDAIPMDAAILMVADSLDAMTSSRTYRRALPLSEACQRIREGSGTQFSPWVVVAFEQALMTGRLILLPSHAPDLPYTPSGRLDVTSPVTGPSSLYAVEPASRSA
jgi:diguanylate cyclase (GGDEF)-like protein